MNTPIDPGFLPARCIRALAAAGISDIEALCSKTRLELLRIEDVGPRTLISITQLLLRHGKSLRGGFGKSTRTDPLQRAFERVLSVHVSRDLAQELAADLMCELNYHRRGFAITKNASELLPTL